MIDIVRLSFKLREARTYLPHEHEEEEEAIWVGFARAHDHHSITLCPCRLCFHALGLHFNALCESGACEFHTAIMMMTS